jgi:aklavinone 12-hydroxylase
LSTIESVPVCSIAMRDPTALGWVRTLKTGNVPMKEYQVPVLVIGAGLAGLSAALTLSHRGVRTMLVERHSGFSRHPRARGLNVRTMELLRSMGVERELCTPEAGTFGDFTIVHAATVLGPAIKTIVQRGAWEVGLSPARSTGMAQCRVEPILKHRAEQLGADIRFSTELLEIKEEPHHVRAVLHDMSAGNDYVVHAAYVIGADGHNSTTRTLLGIGTTGAGLLSNHLGIVFSADIDLPGHAIYYLRQPGFNAAFIHMDDSGESVLSVEQGDANAPAGEYTPEQCLAFIHRALGTSECNLNRLDISNYAMSSFLADTFSTRRVHLIGDAAHTMPPIGGLGGQAAIQDGFDIGWKLDLVLREVAGDDLLKSYEAERKPVAALTVAYQTNRYFQRMRPDKIEGSPAQSERAGVGIAFGYRYRSECILLDGPDDDVAFDDPETLCGRPGTRAPHVQFTHEGRITNVLDLIGGDFLLVAGPAGGSWFEAAERLRREGTFPLSCLQLSADEADADAKWTARHGVSEQGAVLFRPDGFVAWRSNGNPDAYRALVETLTVVLARSDAAVSLRELRSA